MSAADRREPSTKSAAGFARAVACPDALANALTVIYRLLATHLVHKAGCTRKEVTRWCNASAARCQNRLEPKGRMPGVI